MILALAGLAFAAAAPVPEVSRIVERVEAHHRRVSDLTARFVQSYRSGLLGREIVEKGTLSLKRPGRMLWEYREPERKTFLADGQRVFFYVPADRQVIVREQAGQRGVAMTLLSGEASILAQFEATLEDAGGSTPARLRLVPRQPDADVERATLEVDALGRITAIEIVDPQGSRSRFRFEAIRENVGLSDRLFHFEIPRGVEVVTG
jgi:outer membrane lipoprotein carrier protein